MPYAGNAGSGFFVDGHFAAGCRIAHPAVGVVIVSRDAHGGRIPEGNVNGAVDSAAAMLYFRAAENLPGESRSRFASHDADRADAGVLPEHRTLRTLGEFDLSHIEQSLGVQPTLGQKQSLQEQR